MAGIFITLEGGEGGGKSTQAKLLRDALTAGGVTVPTEPSPIVPIIVGGNEAAIAMQQGLAAAGFDARAVRPPTVPAGTARLRVTVRQPVADDRIDGRSKDT